MQIIETSIPGVLIFEPKVFGDDRGFFLETWNDQCAAAIGREHHFVQDNHSRSTRGVLRGLHFQNPNAQGKLVRVSRGKVWDVAVDIRAGSATLGHWVGVELSESNKRMLWIPPGFAHGFLCLEDQSDFLYKCTAPYDASADNSMAWNDPTLAIDWPLDGITPELSAKDQAAKPFEPVHFS